MLSIMGSKKTEVSIDPRYFKIHYLINAKATELLRSQFTCLWTEVTGKEWVNEEGSGRKFSEGVGKEFVASCQRLQKKSIASGNVATWDLALLCGAIKTLFQSVKGRLLQKYITSKEMDELKQIRNKLAHLGSTTIEAEEFETFWTSAVAIMKRLGLTQEDIDAVNKLQCVNELDDDKKTISPEEEKATTFKELGNSAFNGKEYSKAVDFYTSAIHSEGIPSSTLGMLYSNRSASFLALEKVDEAKEDAKRSVTLKPYWPKAYSRLAAVYEEEAKFQKAIIQYQIALSIDPSYKAALEGVEFCKRKISNLNFEQHLDPTFLQANQIHPQLPGREEELGGILGLDDGFRKRMVIEGNPHFLCGEGHRYASGQDGYKQDYATAARLYAQASSLGSAEGKYNLALLTADGKGVRRDMAYYHQLLLEAAQMEPTMEVIEGCGVRKERIGVMESQHVLGICYEKGLVVPQDFKKAAEWYMKAIGNGIGHSANNLALLFSSGRLGVVHPGKAVLYWKLGSYRGTVLAMENLFYHYHENNLLTDLAQGWFDYAVAKGSISLPMRAPYLPTPFKVTEGFDHAEFTNRLKEDLLSSELKHLVPVKSYLRGHPIHDPHGTVEGEGATTTKFVDSMEDPSSYINHHVAIWTEHLKTKRAGQNQVTTSAPKFKATPPSIIGLQPINFKGFEKGQSDKVYKGFAIQVKAVTDVAHMNAISMVVMDENGLFGRIFIYNYPSLSTMQDEIGFGCSFTIINPYHKKMGDGMMGIRVEDPSCVMKLPHLKDASLCRFCFKSGAAFKCRKCIRAKYCSKKCLNEDLEKRSHRLACKKKIMI